MKQITMMMGMRLIRLMGMGMVMGMGMGCAYAAVGERQTCSGTTES